jgi:hypothetical protein
MNRTRVSNTGCRNGHEHRYVANTIGFYRASLLLQIMSVYRKGMSVCGKRIFGCDKGISLFDKGSLSVAFRHLVRDREMFLCGKRNLISASGSRFTAKGHPFVAFECLFAPKGHPFGPFEGPFAANGHPFTINRHPFAPNGHYTGP